MSLQTCMTFFCGAVKKSTCILSFQASNGNKSAIIVHVISAVDLKTRSHW